MTCYYNEHDPFAAAWLRELMADGLIPRGEVDERSIVDVRPSDLDGFVQCHFFAGIGVWPLALRLAGWPDDRPVWTGSCPCQPFSAAGKGGGFADERHLWPAFHWLIDQCRPATVMGEQVSSDDGLAWIDLVLADLDQSGYACGALDTCAAGVGAPHIRQRLYWLAHANDPRLEGWRRVRERADERAVGARSVDGRMADTQHTERRPQRVDGQDGCDRAHGGRPEAHGLARACGEIQRMADAADPRCNQARQHDGGPSPLPARPVEHGGVERMADTGEERQHEHTKRDGTPLAGVAHDASRRDDAGRCGVDYRPGPTNGLWRNADWLGCRDGKWRPVESSPLSMADVGTIRRALDEGGGAHFYSPLAPAGSIKNRVGMLRGAGNALNLGQATAFIQAVIRDDHAEV